MAKIVTLTSRPKRVAKHFVEQDGKEVEARYTSTIDQYGDDVTVYKDTLTKGKAKGQVAYLVAVKDYKSSARSSKATAMSALLSRVAKGELTAKQLTEEAAKQGIQIQ